MLETDTHQGMTRDEMEARRMKAMVLFSRHFICAKVARDCGVSRTTATRWKRRLQNGMDGMKKRKAPGRPPTLNSAQLSEASRLYQPGWTAGEFQQAIYQRFQVLYNRDHVLRLMWKLGLRERRDKAKTRVQVLFPGHPEAGSTGNPDE